MPPLILTRQQLYDRVWATPIDALAPTLGLSGRGLGKLCARYDIPVPPRGHWAKLAAGKRVSRPELPFPVRADLRIQFSVPSGQPKAEEPTAFGEHPLIAFEQDRANLIAVPDDLPIAHPGLLAAERPLLRAKRDTAGLVAAPTAPFVHTSREQHGRALRILQALLAACESRGFSASVKHDGIWITVLDEPLAIAVVENTKGVPHPVTFTEQKLIDRGLGYQVPKHDVIPSGALSMVITNVRHVRQRWTEGSGKPLERIINRFIVGLVRAALGLKHQHAEAERRESERQEAERRREEEAQRQAKIARRWREEQGKVERLERLAQVWRRNQELRRLAQEIRSATRDAPAESELAKWLSWIEEQLEGSDPLRHLRERKGGTITVYYHHWDRDRVAERGFSDPDTEAPRFGAEKEPRGVELTCRPTNGSSWSETAGLKLELPEEFLLPYEWAQNSDWLWRTFRVPADALNRAMGYGATNTPPA